MASFCMINQFTSRESASMSDNETANVEAEKRKVRQEESKHCLCHMPVMIMMLHIT